MISILFHRIGNWQENMLWQRKLDFRENKKEDLKNYVPVVAVIFISFFYLFIFLFLDEVYRDDVGMCVDAIDIAFLGSAYPLFFTFIKCSFTILFGYLVLTSFPFMYLNAKGNFCLPK